MGRIGEDARRIGKDAGRIGEDAGRIGKDAGRIGEDAGRTGEDAGRTGEAAGLVLVLLLVSRLLQTAAACPPRRCHHSQCIRTYVLTHCLYTWSWSTPCYSATCLGLLLLSRPCSPGALISCPFPVAPCCTHLAPLSHLIVRWALPFGCLVCVLGPASDAVLPNGTIALAPTFAHMPGLLATAACVLRRTVNLTHTVSCGSSLHCDWFSVLWLAPPLHRQTLWCPTGPTIWPWQPSFHCHTHVFWPVFAYSSAPAPVFPAMLSYILAPWPSRYISIMDDWCWCSLGRWPHGYSPLKTFAPAFATLLSLMMVASAVARRITAALSTMSSVWLYVSGAGVPSCVTQRCPRSTRRVRVGWDIDTACIL